MRKIKRLATLLLAAALVLADSPLSLAVNAKQLVSEGKEAQAENTASDLEASVSAASSESLTEEESSKAAETAAKSESTEASDQSAAQSSQTAAASAEKETKESEETKEPEDSAEELQQINIDYSVSEIKITSETDHNVKKAVGSFLLPYDKTKFKSTYTGYTLQLFRKEDTGYKLIKSAKISDMITRKLFFGVTTAYEDKYANEYSGEPMVKDQEPYKVQKIKRDENGEILYDVNGDPILVYDKDGDPTWEYYEYKCDLSEWIDNEKVAGDYCFNILTSGSNHSVYSSFINYSSSIAAFDRVPAPTGLTWDLLAGDFTGSVSWTAPAISASVVDHYKVVLYHGKSSDDESTDDKMIIRDANIEKIVYTSGDECTADLVTTPASITGNDGLYYKFTVTAITKDFLTASYSEAAESKPLANRLLLKPDSLSWQGMNARWAEVTGASYYSVNIRKDGIIIDSATRQVAAGNGQYATCDFTSYLKDAIKKAPNSKYVFEVKAVPVTTSILAESNTVLSPDYNYKNQITDIQFDNNTGLISFYIGDVTGDYTMTIHFAPASGGSYKKLVSVPIGSFSDKDDDYLFTYDGHQFLSSAGYYKVNVKERKTGQEYFAAFTFTPAVSVLVKPQLMIDNNLGSKNKTTVIWSKSSYTTSDGEEAVSGYEIKIYNDKVSQLIFIDGNENTFYDLNDDVLATGCNKVTIRAVSRRLQTVMSSKWSNEVTIDNSKLRAVSRKDYSILDENGDETGLTYSLYGNKNNLTLEINGSGALPDYAHPNNTSELTAPWAPFGGHIKNLKLNGEITNIGDYSFYGLSLITTVAFPDAVNRIGKYAFEGCAKLAGDIKIPAGVTSVNEGAFNSSPSIKRMIFRGKAPVVVPLTSASSTPSMNANVTVNYNTRTSGWESIENGKWKGYKIAPMVFEVEALYLRDCNELSEHYDEAVSSYGLDMEYGASHQIQVICDPLDATNQNVKYSSSSSNVATVSNTGLVFAKNPGVAVITVTSVTNKNLKATCTVVVYNLMKTGWQKSGNYYYYVDSSQGSLKGWQKLPLYGDKSAIPNEYWQYFDPVTGLRKTGWLTITDKTVTPNEEYKYYLDTKSGKLYTGYTKVGENWYNFRETDSNDPTDMVFGAAEKGFSADAMHYFDKKTGAAIKGWKEVTEDTWYYFDNNGYKLSGWENVGGKFYYFSEGNSEEAANGIKQYGTVEHQDYSKKYSRITLHDDISGNDYTYLLQGINYDNKTETNNGCLVTGWHSYKVPMRNSSGNIVKDSNNKTVFITKTYYFDPNKKDYEYGSMICAQSQDKPRLFKVGSNYYVFGATYINYDEDGELIEEYEPGLMYLPRDYDETISINDMSITLEKGTGKMKKSTASSANGFYEYGDGVVYIKNGVLVTGWMEETVGGVKYKYYFDPLNNGIALGDEDVSVYNQYYIDDKAYLFNGRYLAKGTVFTDIDGKPVSITDDVPIFMYKDGVRQTGFISGAEYGVKSYYYARPKSGSYDLLYGQILSPAVDQDIILRNISNKWYAFDATGKRIDGAIIAMELNGDEYTTMTTDKGVLKAGFKHADGYFVSGQVTGPEGEMLFNNKGMPLTGMQTYKGGDGISRKFFYDTYTGLLKTGEFETGKKLYYSYQNTYEDVYKSNGTHRDYLRGELAVSAWIIGELDADDEYPDGMDIKECSEPIFDPEPSEEILEDTTKYIRFVGKNGLVTKGWLKVTTKDENNKKVTRNYYFDKNDDYAAFYRFTGVMVRNASVDSGKSYVDRLGRKR